MHKSELRRSWANKLKTPALGKKPKRRVKKVNWCLPGLPRAARFLCNLPPDSPLFDVIEKVSQSRCAYIIGRTLHIHALLLSTRNELNFISLVTHFQLVDKVRLHTFHLNFYLTARRVHVRIQSVNWEVVKLILQFIHRGPWVVKGSTRERAIKVKFDEFLQPAAEAWKRGLPYRHLVFDIPEYKIELISTYTNLPWVHRGLSALAEGYSSDSDLEVDFAHEVVDSSSEEEEYDIIQVNGCPFFLEPLM